MGLEAHREQMVAHFVWMLQIDADYARWSISNYQRTPHIPFPNIQADVKARLDLLGIEPEPRQQQEPWYLQRPDNQGWRLNPGVTQ